MSGPMSGVAGKPVDRSASRWLHSAPVPAELLAVPDFPAAEAAVRGGIDSAQLVVLAGQDAAAAQAAAEQGVRAGRGPLPSRRQYSTRYTSGARRPMTCPQDPVIRPQ